MPARTMPMCAGSYMSQPCSSQRMNCTRTGLPTFCESSAAASAASSYGDCPKQLEPSKNRIRTDVAGSPSVDAIFVRVL